MIHRDNDLPAMIKYNKNETIKYEAWWKYNKKHRSSNNGKFCKYKPAIIRHTGFKLISKVWYINGMLITTDLDLKITSWYNKLFPKNEEESSILS